MKINIAYIGGGSRAWARSLMSDLANQDNFCGDVRLYDIDKSASEDNAIIGNSLKESKNAKTKFNYTVANTLGEALTDADFILISILPGTFDEMESDVHTPEKFGIYQAVGDTVGPGGILRAMRTYPMYEEIALAIKKYSPNAWVINYTNPMSMCLKMLYTAFPKIKAIGCCHEVFHTQYLLTKALEEFCGIKGVDRHELTTSVCGINHFTYLTEAKYKDIDLFKVYDKVIEKYYYKGFNPDGEWDDFKRNVFLCSNRVKMNLYKRYKYIAAAGDRHLAEFCPKSWYLKDKATVEEWMFNLTPISWRKEDQINKIKTTKEIVNKEKSFDIFFTGEEGTHILTALLGLGDIVTNVNFPNYGQYTNAPIGSIVETNMKISKNKVEMVKPETLPNDLNALILKVLYNQETIVEGCKNRDIEKIFNAFVNDSLCATLDLKDARKLFEEMIQNTKKYLTSYGVK